MISVDELIDAVTPTRTGGPLGAGEKNYHSSIDIRNEKQILTLNNNRFIVRDCS